MYKEGDIVMVSFEDIGTTLYELAKVEQVEKNHVTVRYMNCIGSDKFKLSTNKVCGGANAFIPNSTIHVFNREAYEKTNTKADKAKIAAFLHQLDSQQWFNLSLDELLQIRQIISSSPNKKQVDRFRPKVKERAADIHALYTLVDF